MNTIALNLNPVGKLTEAAFEKLCQANPDIALERTAIGELIIVSPVGGDSGRRETDLISHVWFWNRQTQLGVVFSSSTIFHLPNGAFRSPDVAWVRRDRWVALSESEKAGFPPICPDFVIELRSRTDRLPPLQDKMREYLDNGIRLGWLINPQGKQVEIYRPNVAVEVLSSPTSLSGEDVLPGLAIALSEIIDID
jgi:Uma2 family endonuclease